MAKNPNNIGNKPGKPKPVKSLVQKSNVSAKDLKLKISAKDLVKKAPKNTSTARGMRGPGNSTKRGK